MINSIEIVEVSARDGLQSEKEIVSTIDKLSLIKRAIDAGLKRIEITSFVSPKRVPQMADAENLVQMLPEHNDVTYTGLVLNYRGFERARDLKLDEVGCAVMATETFNKRNQGVEVNETIKQWTRIADNAHKENMKAQIIIGAAFGCPFEGNISTKSLADISKEYKSMGFKGVTLGDTTGMATPPVVADAIKAIRDKVPDLGITLHFHNTRGVGLANVMSGLYQGITDYESCFGGMGGCPFAPNATGNICSEDLIYLLHEMGIETGIDLDKLISIAQKVEGLVGHKLPGQVMRAGHRLLSYSMDDVPTAIGA